MGPSLPQRADFIKMDRFWSKYFFCIKSFYGVFEDIHDDYSYDMDLEYIDLGDGKLSKFY